MRYGLPTAHGRGIDLLPAEVTAPFEGSLVRRIETRELVRAFGVVMEGLAAEIRIADPELAVRLDTTLRVLSEPSR